MFPRSVINVALACMQLIMLLKNVSGTVGWSVCLLTLPGIKIHVGDALVASMVSITRSGNTD